LDALVAALRRLPELGEVEAGELFDIEKKAFLASERSGYKKTAVFLIAMVFERLARKSEGEEPKSGQTYSVICERAIGALAADDWNGGAQKLEELVDISWRSQLLH
jgi:hypothetical protein